MNNVDEAKGGSTYEDEGFRKSPKRRITIFLVIFFAIGSVLLALLFWPSDGERPLPSATEYPSFVYNSAQVLQAYEIAVSIPEVLPLMPCYCNCGNAHGHKSLKDCFFKDDGSLNDHGAFCEICDMEVVDIAKWQETGYSLKEIRDKIDGKYTEYGEPTDTPPLI